MSKYIIELGEDAKAIQSISVTSLGNVYVDSWYVENLEELNSDYINEHFGDLQDEAYKRGLEDGKAQSERGCKGCEYEEIRNERCRFCANGYPNQWQAKQTDDEIKAGDEVICNNQKFVVFVPETEEHYASLFDVNGRHLSASQIACKKTGRHFDIDKILEEMNE